MGKRRRNARTYVKSHRLIRGEETDVAREGQDELAPEVLGFFPLAKNEMGGGALKTFDGWRPMNMLPLYVSPFAARSSGDTGDGEMSLIALDLASQGIEGTVFCTVSNGDAGNTYSDLSMTEGEFSHVYQERWGEVFIEGSVKTDEDATPDTEMVPMVYVNNASFTSVINLDFNGTGQFTQLFETQILDAYISLLGRDFDGVSWVIVDRGDYDSEGNLLDVADRNKLDAYKVENGVFSSLIGTLGSYGLGVVPTGRHNISSVCSYESGDSYCYTLVVDIGNDSITTAKLFKITSSSVTEVGDLDVTLGSGVGEYRRIDGLAWVTGSYGSVYLMTIGHKNGATDSMDAIVIDPLDASSVAIETIRTNDDIFMYETNEASPSKFVLGFARLLLGPDSYYYFRVNDGTDKKILRFQMDSSLTVQNMSEFWDVTSFCSFGCYYTMNNQNRMLVCGVNSSSEPEFKISADGAAVTNVTLPSAIGAQAFGIYSAFIADFDGTQDFVASVYNDDVDAPQLVRIASDGTVNTSYIKFTDAGSFGSYLATTWRPDPDDPTGEMISYINGIIAP